MATESQKFDHLTLEKNWQETWQKQKLYQADIQGASKPFYNLMMFPYPSAEGLHVGNVYAFTGSDIYGRFKKLQGFEVFEPMGFDAFGIHSENYAIQVKKHPNVLIPQNTQNFTRQLNRLGAMFDWSRAVNTTDPKYYRWTQWIFLKLHEAGLVYRKNAPVNWCLSCKTVLSNEQVEGGTCERCGKEVIQKELEQWFVKITQYTERLLKNLEHIQWSSRTKKAQENWIGRSEGAEILFRTGEHDLWVFTTRPDTLCGATYMVLSPEHPLVDRLVTPAQKNAVEAYRQQAKRKNKIERTDLSKDKTGVALGATAKNPLTGKEIPIWISDYVLMDYGTGAIMAVPAHDQRDFDFAKKFSLPIIQVIAQDGQALAEPMQEAHAGEGVLINSGEWNGLSYEKAKKAITENLATKNLAKAKIQYRLNDWCISRQRYWGPPIPFIHCGACGLVPVPEKDLPVLLPQTDDFYPDDSGKSPLAKIESFVNTTCPKCRKGAKRDTDVCDNFLDSAWYFLRYPCANDDTKAFDPAIIRKWLPVDMYIGGNEHAVLHLMYTRFLCMALHDAKILPFEEPFKQFFAHGLIIKDGFKMSKSKGNVVIPDAFLDRYGADTFRTYLMFLGPYSEGGDFSDSGIIGVRRFMERVYALKERTITTTGKENPEILTTLHRTIKAVSEDMATLSYNTAIARLMELQNAFKKVETLEKDTVEKMLILLAPFAPHLAEEIWQHLGHQTSIFKASWPGFDAKYLQEENVEMVIQVNSKIRARLTLKKGASEEEVGALALADPRLKDYVTGKQVVKRIFIADKLINFVVR